MFYKLWKNSQLTEISQTLKKLENQNEFCRKKYHTAILDKISEYIQLLNAHYGEERHPDKSLGGWVAVLTDRSLETIEEEYKSFLNQHRLTRDTAEIREPVIECQNNIHWILEIHIASDFHYILIYPCQTFLNHTKSIEKEVITCPMCCSE